MIKVSFHTFGCKCNLSDTNDMALSLLEKGDFLVLDAELKAEIHVINTCAVTASAEAQARNLVRKLDKHNIASLIVIAGCSNRREKGPYDALFSELSGNNKYLAFDNLEQDLSSIICTFVDIKTTSSSAKDTGSNVFRTRAFVKVQDGCESFCSYCIVPFVRGKERSRPKDLILEEINRLYSEGVKEVVLTGINIGSYSGGLVSLLESILITTKMPRIRLSSLRPSKFSPELIELMKEKRICPHVHVSLQSGSDKILSSMNRFDYTADDFKKAVERYFDALKARSPFVAADVIVGFPGEDKDDFNRTYELLKGSNISKLHVFVFSPRPGTKAFDMKGIVPAAEAKERSHLLLELSRQKYLASLSTMKGKKVEVLWEDNETGHTDNYYPVTGQGVKNSIELRMVSGLDLESGALVV